MYKTVQGKVIGLKPYGAFVKTEDGNSGLCHISEISDYFVSDISKVLQIYETYEFAVLEEKTKDTKIKLSFKAIRPEMSKHFFPIETKTGFKNIKSKIEKDIINYEV